MTLTEVIGESLPLGRTVQLLCKEPDRVAAALRRQLPVQRDGLWAHWRTQRFEVGITTVQWYCEDAHGHIVGPVTRFLIGSRKSMDGLRGRLRFKRTGPRKWKLLAGASS